MFHLMFYSAPLQAVSFAGILKEKFQTWIWSYHLLMSLSTPVGVKRAKEECFFLSLSLSFPLPLPQICVIYRGWGIQCCSKCQAQHCRHCTHSYWQQWTMESVGAGEVGKKKNTTRLSLWCDYWSVSLNYINLLLCHSAESSGCPVQHKHANISMSFPFLCSSGNKSVFDTHPAPVMLGFEVFL